MATQTIVLVAIFSTLLIFLLLFILYVANVFPNNTGMSDNLRNALEKYADVGRFIALYSVEPYNITGESPGSYATLNTSQVSIVNNSRELFDATNDKIRAQASGIVEIHVDINFTVTSLQPYHGDIDITLGFTRNGDILLESEIVKSCQQGLFTHMVLPPRILQISAGDEIQCVLRIADQDISIAVHSSYVIISSSR